MRLLKLEIKRILKTRMTLILLALSLVLSAVMAWLPVTFCYAYTTDENGNSIKLTGMDAVEHTKTVQAGIAGTVTPEKVRQALESYQACLRKYGVTESYDLPDGVYDAEITPYAPLLRGIREAFSDPETGIATPLMEIDPEWVDRYYEVCEEHILSLMKIEQGKHPAAQAAGAALYGRVTKPFRFYPGYNSDAIDYQLLFSFLLVLFCTVISAPVFTSDYQTGADDILRCTKHGKIKFAAVKILSAFLISGTAYILCIGIYLLISNSLFGWECGKTSMQLLYSVVNLPDLNLMQLQTFLAGSGLLCLLATVSFTLFLSSRSKAIVTSLSISLLFCFLPVIIYMLLPARIGIWIYSILPASGVGIQASFLYALLDFQFWNIGSFAIWLPHVMLGACILEIPVFTALTTRSYLQHSI